MTTRRFISLAVGAATIAASAVLTIGVPAASAAAYPCAPSAKITHSSGSGYISWAGRETKGQLKKFTGSHVTYGTHFYELHGKTITLAFGGNTFVLGSNAVFALNCSGTAAGQKAKMPSIRMLRGKATVRTTHAVEGSVAAEDGLFGPIPGSSATSFTVSRTLRQHSPLTLMQAVYWFMEYTNEPAGTSRITTLTHTLVNVTPYVGPRRGSCRHVHSAVLTTTSTYGHGTAIYHF